MFAHKRISEGLFEGKKVLDIGCGRRKKPGAVGLDHYPLPGVDVVADLNATLPFSSESFDIVFADQVLEHVPRMVELVYEVWRVLKPGGLFVAHLPYFRSSWAHLDPTHVRGFAINSLDYFVCGTFCYEHYRFRDEGFGGISVFLDTDYPVSPGRFFMAPLALKAPFLFENSFLSSVFIFQQVSYVLTK